MSGRDFPEQEILVARGKYSTLSSEKRAALKGLQDDMQALANYAHRILRAATDRKIDAEFLEQEIQHAGARVGSAHGHLHTIVSLAPAMAELKPQAWGGKEVEHE